MSKLIIRGGKRLEGVVRVSGNKNSMFPLVAASLLASSPVTLTNVPKIKDVDILCEMVEELGVRVEKKDGVLVIDPAGIASKELNADLASKIRGSIVLAAPLLARFGKVSMPRPGGDPIGIRPLGSHLEALSSFGATSKAGHYGTIVAAKNLKSASIFLEEASPTATEMAMIVAAGIAGETIIEGAAAEPHVVDLAEMLIAMGASVDGAGSSIVRVKGTKSLKGVEHKVRADHTEVGTLVAASAITGGDVLIQDVRPEDLKMILAYFGKMGVQIKFEGSSSLRVLPSQLVATQKVFQTRPWPGFPTDLISPFIVLATQTAGTVLIHDWMYEWRIFFVDYLIRMGANITIADPHRVFVVGPSKLYGELIPSPDIRAGAALVLAALVARGESTVEHAEVIDRGYEAFDTKLSQLGADIRRSE